MKLITKSNESVTRTDAEIAEMIEAGTKAYGEFLLAMGFDYKADLQTIDTPRRVAKAWVNDVIMGSCHESPSTKTFPNEDNYSGVVIQTGIRINSMCAHHNLPFYGWCSIAYVPGENVIGLSKLNRIADWYARRPQMQESLTEQIHRHLADVMLCPDVAVSVACKHLCCGSRGIKHPESVMTTNKFSGVFMEPGNLIREEFIAAIAKNGVNF